MALVPVPPFALYKAYRGERARREGERKGKKRKKRRVLPRFFVEIDSRRKGTNAPLMHNYLTKIGEGKLFYCKSLWGKKPIN